MAMLVHTQVQSFVQLFVTGSLFWFLTLTFDVCMSSSLCLLKLCLSV